MKRFYLLAALLLSIPNVLVQESLPIGTEPPRFTLPATDGSTVSLDTYLKKNVVVLHFWKTR